MVCQITKFNNNFAYSFDWQKKWCKSNVFLGYEKNYYITKTNKIYLLSILFSI